MDEITGILYSKILGVGTRSKGPKYYIKPLDDYANRWSEIVVRKKTNLWENDPVLHKRLNKKYLSSEKLLKL